MYNLHISFILFAIGLVLLNDLIGFVWAVGLKRQFSERFLKAAHGLIGVAFLGAVGTGIALAVSKPEIIRHNGFWIKMTFVAMIGVNGVFMGRKCSTLAQRRFASFPTRAKVSIILSVMLSLALWLGTAVLALFAMRAHF
jgi:hypothetical protein